MAKSVGFIGNMKGKVGNVVGFKVSQSNSGTNQGVRVYQPNIKNPKSAAQAEQRAKYAPIFATYRALKMIIDRGNESKTYGNASRIAWLKKAFRSTEMPWFIKGSIVDWPIGTYITYGSLGNIRFEWSPDFLDIVCEGVQEEGPYEDLGEVSGALMEAYPFLKKGDQISLIGVGYGEGNLYSRIYSFIIDPESTERTTFFDRGIDEIHFLPFGGDQAITVIVSREGTNGEHLRSTSKLVIGNDDLSDFPYREQDKQAAISSYMATDSANADWAEESIQ